LKHITQDIPIILLKYKILDKNMSYELSLMKLQIMLNELFFQYFTYDFFNPSSGLLRLFSDPIESKNSRRTVKERSDKVRPWIEEDPNSGIDLMPNRRSSTHR
jgi:hypothetical protein